MKDDYAGGGDGEHASPSAMTLETVVQSPHVLRDYAFLADGIRGAPLDPDGELAWLCFPAWSDPAVLTGLPGSGGTYRVTPPCGRHVHGGWYEDGSLIWRSRWVSDDGIVEGRDALATAIGR
jgi:hypothetical protein